MEHRLSRLWSFGVQLGLTHNKWSNHLRHIWYRRPYTDMWTHIRPSKLVTVPSQRSCLKCPRQCSGPENSHRLQQCKADEKSSQKTGKVPLFESTYSRGCPATCKAAVTGLDNGPCQKSQISVSQPVGRLTDLFSQASLKLNATGTHESSKRGSSSGIGTTGAAADASDDATKDEEAEATAAAKVGVKPHSAGKTPPLPRRCLQLALPPSRKYRATCSSPCRFSQRGRGYSSGKGGSEATFGREDSTAAQTLPPTCVASLKKVPCHLFITLQVLTEHALHCTTERSGEDKDGHTGCLSESQVSNLKAVCSQQQPAALQEHQGEDNAAEEVKWKPEPKARKVTPKEKSPRTAIMELQEADIAQSLSDMDVACLPIHSLHFLKNSNYAKVRIGRGNYGTVFLAKLEQRSRLVAVKQFAFRTKGTLHQFLQEVQIMRKLQSTGWVPDLLGVTLGGQIPDELYLVQDFYANGTTLHSVLLDRSIDPPPNIWLNVVVQLVIGLQTIHNSEILLNDLKADNVLVDCSKFPFNIKFIDFGLACQFPSVRYFNKPEELTPFSYMAPEVRRGQPTSVHSDVFSLGFLIQSVVKHKTLQEYAVAQKIADLCLHEHPKDRPSLVTLMDMLDGAYRC